MSARPIVPYNNLSIVDTTEKNEVISAIDKILTSGKIINGEEIEQFERSIAGYVGVKSAIAVSSGTSSLVLALRACGVGAGDEVIVPCMSWISTAHAVSIVGASPVFADIGEDLNISPSSVEKMISTQTKAILPVHFHGRVGNVKRIKEIVGKKDIKIIEDGSQAFGSKTEEGFVGSLGDVGCFSFNPMKVLSAAGEAGVMVTNDECVLDKTLKMRYLGLVDKTNSSFVAGNDRMDTMQAAILLNKLNRFDETKKRRLEIYMQYEKAFAGANVSRVKPPSQEQFVPYAYTITVNDRERFQHKMLERGIETKVIHSPLMCNQKPYMSYKRDTLLGGRIVDKMVSLPLWNGLSVDKIDYVIECVKEFKDV